MGSRRFSQEILDTIIGHLDPKEDRETGRVCSLIPYLRQAGQGIWFSHVTLTGTGSRKKGTMTTCTKFRQFLTDAPRFASYIRYITLSRLKYEPKKLKDDNQLPPVLLFLPNLASIRVFFGEIWWYDLSQELHDAFLAVTSTCPIEELHFDGIHHIPLSLLKPALRLSKLYVIQRTNSVCFNNDLEDETEDGPSRGPKLLSLSTIVLWAAWEEDVEALSALLSTPLESVTEIAVSVGAPCDALIELIHGCPSAERLSMRISEGDELDLRRLPSLQYLDLTMEMCFVTGEIEDPFPFLRGVLASINKENFLEIVSLTFALSGEPSQEDDIEEVLGIKHWADDSADWDKLDKLLTTPAFTDLKTVRIAFYPDSNHTAAFENFNETTIIDQLPRLRRKGILEIDVINQTGNEPEDLSIYP